MSEGKLGSTLIAIRQRFSAESVRTLHSCGGRLRTRREPPRRTLLQTRCHYEEPERFRMGNAGWLNLCLSSALGGTPGRHAERNDKNHK
jgi:hypothetical protein